MTSTIDWMGQLEVVEPDGKVYYAVLLETRTEGAHTRRVGYAGKTRQWFTEDGRLCISDSVRVRNALEPIAVARPSTEALDRFEALLGRLEAAVGAISKGEVK